MRRIIIILCQFYALTLCTPPRISKVYRSDYEYNEKTDAFYKLHIDGATFDTAKKKCESENAKLMLPATHFDEIQLHGMLKKYPNLYDYVWINEASEVTNSDEENPVILADGIINAYNEDETYYDNASQSSTTKCDAMSRQSEIKSLSCHGYHAFICKVEANVAPYDSECDVYGTDYQYVRSVGSCYRISKAAYSWNEAYADCRAQGSHLVVLNSEAEHLAVKRIMQNTTLLTDAYSPYYYIAGFRANKPDRTFFTVFNQTLAEAGYSEWADTEPNNYAGSEFCGSLYEVDGKLNDHNCKNIYGFICEKEKHI